MEKNKLLLIRATKPWGNLNPIESNSTAELRRIWKRTNCYRFVQQSLSTAGKVAAWVFSNAGQASNWVKLAATNESRTLRWIAWGERT